MPKPYLDINGQIQNLTEAKGLIITDLPYARQKLSDISYVSLIGGYKVPFFNGVSHKYINCAAFEDIVSLYEFDKSLRLLTFGYITSVEEKLRQQIVDAFCGKFGELQSAFLTPAITEMNLRIHIPFTVLLIYTLSLPFRIKIMHTSSINEFITVMSPYGQ